MAINEAREKVQNTFYFPPRDQFLAVANGTSVELADSHSLDGIAIVGCKAPLAASSATARHAGPNHKSIPSLSGGMEVSLTFASDPIIGLGTAGIGLWVQI